MCHVAGHCEIFHIFVHSLQGSSAEMRLSWIFPSCLLQTFICLCFFSDSQCERIMQPGLYHDGNVLIAGFVPLYNYYLDLGSNLEASEHHLIQCVSFKISIVFVMPYSSAFKAIQIYSNIPCNFCSDISSSARSLLQCVHSFSSIKEEKRISILFFLFSVFLALHFTVAAQAWYFSNVISAEGIFITCTQRNPQHQLCICANDCSNYNFHYVLCDQHCLFQPLLIGEQKYENLSQVLLFFS